MCDDERMANYFWRNVAMYAPRYKALVRVESMDFDPMVNRYFEAQFVESGESANASRSTNTGSDNSAVVTNIINGGSSKEYPKTVMTVATDGTTHDEGTDVTGATNATEQYNSVRDQMQHTGTVTDVLNGTVTDSGAVNKNEMSSANSTSLSDGIANAAHKEAPMSASGLTYSNTGSHDLPSGKDGQHLNNPDLTYATGYSHSDSINGTKTESGATGTTHENSNNTKVTSDNTVKTLNNSDTNTKTGSISRTTDAVTNTKATDGNNHSATVTSYASGSVIEKEDASTSSQQVTNQGTNSQVGTVTGTDTHNRTSTNRYTGREGLTPQDAMMSATDYLTNYSIAFKWFVNKLDSCFIMLYDV